MSTKRQLLSRDQVKAAERGAWAEFRGQEFYFDGINFWEDGPQGLRAAAVDTTPQAGWRHGPKCACPFCRDAVS